MVINLVLYNSSVAFSVAIIIILVTTNLLLNTQQCDCPTHYSGWLNGSCLRKWIKFTGLSNACRV